jgi:lipopolysaccharide export LptBFGC system permease protein LptF
MVFARYFFNRFIRYFLVIAISFTLLLTFIEFFEKLLRVGHTTILTICYFLTLNFLPAFFGYVPISSWLATIFFVKEIIQQNEWDIFKMLGIKSDKLFKLFLGTGFIVMTFSFVCQESLVDSLSSKVETFKREQFKLKIPHTIINSWFTLSQTQFCHIGFYNLETNEGKQFLLIKLDKNFNPKKVLTAQEFRADLTEGNLTLCNVKQFQTLTGTEKEHRQFSITLPTLPKQLQLQTKRPTLSETISYLFAQSTFFPTSFLHTLAADVLKRLLWYLQILLFPLLTFLLFVNLQKQSQVMWVAMLSVYPTFTMLEGVTDYLFKRGTSLAILTLPYCCLILLILFLRRRLAYVR